LVVGGDYMRDYGVLGTILVVLAIIALLVFIF
jgi:hypothetical protein